MTEPIRLEAGQPPVPAVASATCASVQSDTAGIRPTRPAGSTVLICERYCWPEGRVTVNEKLVDAPPVAGWLVRLLRERERQRRVARFAGAVAVHRERRVRRLP